MTEPDELEPNAVVVPLTITAVLKTAVEQPYELQAEIEYSYVPAERPIS